jgi:N-acetyl-anhydromuramoyl-L-alanine amidase
LQESGGLAVTADPNHWLDRVRRVESPNADNRPDGTPIALIVLHGISLPPGQFGGRFVEDLFINRLDIAAHASFTSLAGVRVSAHVFINRRGGITQFVPFDRRAWHAGVSQWRGRIRCNDFSIGIELEGTDDRRYTSSQYAALARTLKILFVQYPELGRDTVVGHSEISPGRKTDPGAFFDWKRLYKDLED